MCCKKVTPETLTALYDGGLSPLQRWGLGFHCLWCWRCQSDLLSLASFDQKLQKLAPLPVEPKASLQSNLRYIGASELFMVDRRILKAWLAGILLLLVLLGLGIWRFFTPEITWTDVEKAMGEVKTAQWRRTLTVTPRQQSSTEPALLLDTFVRWTDSALRQPSVTLQREYFARAEPSWRTATQNYPGLVDSSLYRIDHHDFLVNPSVFRSLSPYQQETPTHVTVRLWHGKRVLAFFGGGVFFADSDTILVDPQTRRVVYRERHWNNTATSLADSAGQVDEITEVLTYDAPLTPEMCKKSENGSWEYQPTPEEKIQLDRLATHYLESARPNEGKRLLPYSINARNFTLHYAQKRPIKLRPQKIGQDEQPILTLHFRQEGSLLHVQKQPDGSFNQVESL